MLIQKNLNLIYFKVDVKLWPHLTFRMQALIAYSRKSLESMYNLMLYCWI